MTGRRSELEEELLEVELGLKRAELVNTVGHKNRLAQRKAHMEQFRHTRDIQWKVNVALWTLLAALLAAGYSIERDKPAGSIWVPAVLTFLTLLHLWWLVLMQVSLERDKDVWRLDPREGDDILPAESDTKPRKQVASRWKTDLQRLKGTGVQWIAIQWLFTVSLSVSAWMLLKCPPAPVHDDTRARLEALERLHAAQGLPTADDTSSNEASSEEANDE